MRTSLWAGVMALVVAASVNARQEPARAPAPNSGTAAALLAEVLARAAQYVAEYQTRLAGIVAEERYTQDVRRVGSNATSTMTSSFSQHRELRSDLLLVRPTGEGPWLQFRDVFEVDGKPLRDRDERLLKLFVETKIDARGQAESIAQEGARYNIGPITRTINVPVLALNFFTGVNQPRSRFIRVSPGNLKRYAGLAAEANIWAIEFREVAPDTLVRGGAFRDLPSHGRAWVESTTGRVLRTELITEDIRVRAQVDVAYGPQLELDVLVPVEMREQYQFRTGGMRIDGAAKYSRFRQFKVTTEEKTKPPGPLK